MDERQEELKIIKTNDIIRKHLLFSVAAGSLPVPVADVVVITSIQMDMLRQIAEVYMVDFNKEAGKSFASSLIGVSIARIGASFFKALPGIGLILGVGAQAILAGASTYAIGKLFQSHFSNHGTMLDFDVESVRDKYEDLLRKGKEVVRELREKSKRDDLFGSIEKLLRLKEMGAITTEEFEETKRKLLNKINNV